LYFETYQTRTINYKKPANSKIYWLFWWNEFELKIAAASFFILLVKHRQELVHTQKSHPFLAISS
jgi:hypothetical protein